MKHVSSFTYLRHWAHLVSCLLFEVLFILLTGCTTPPPNMPAHMTVTPTVFSWETLQRRPLHLPSLKSGQPCPTTRGRQVTPSSSDFFLGNGPIYADFFGGDASTRKQSILQYVDAQTYEGGTSGWGGQKVIWFIDPIYHGPALIRGKQLDGSGQVRFDSEPNEPAAPAAHTLLNALRIIGGGAGDPWPSWPSNTRLQMPGCYAYQVDGPNFSEIIVFKATSIHILLNK